MLTWIGRSRARLARALVRIVAAASGRRAVPIVVVNGIRRIGVGANPLLPASRRTDASSVRTAPLRRLLDGAELGYWALGPQSIDELARTVAEVRPGAVIEYGSGSSTLVLAWALRRLWGTGAGPRVVSIEQDAAHAGRTRELLERAGLAGEVAVVVAPLAEVEVDGSRVPCYALPDRLMDPIGGRSADLVIIDGPAGPPGARFGTLPLALPYLADGARFLLDDALRDSELGIANRWSALPNVHVDGIRLIEKGLLVGTVRAR